MNPPRINRRSFLGGAAATMGLLAVGACASGDGPAERGGGNTLAFANWPLYIDPAVLDDFTAATGIDVSYTEEINDNDEYFAKISEPLRQGKGIGRDLIVVSDWLAARLIELGWAQALDRSAIPNRTNLLDELGAPSFDPGRTHTLTWQAGITGIAYDVTRTGRELTSVEEIFDPAFAGHVSMLTEMEDTVGLIMLGMGRDPAAATLGDVQAATEKIKGAVEGGQVRRFTGNDYASDLARGDVWVAFAWSGDVIQLQADNENLRFLIPDEGGILWSDEMLIPAGATNPAAAHALMDYVYQPEVAAQIAAEVQYICPVKDVGDKLASIDADLAEEELIVPTAEIRARLHSFRSLDSEEQQQFNEVFQAVARL